jgi:hypothetical protein
MSAQAIDEPAPWCPPPPDECEEHRYTAVPDGAHAREDRVMVRLKTHIATQTFVEFALVQQVYWQGEWRDVVEADSCHDVDVHLHRYGRSTDSRIGEPEVLMLVHSLDDLQEGYDLAYTHVFEDWSDNRRRWERA